MASIDPSRTPNPDDGPIQSLSAVTLLTRDMATAMSFYEALGFRMIYGGPTDALTSFRAGSSFLNLMTDPSYVPARIWGRPIFWVDDVDAMHDRAIAAGYTPSFAPEDAPWGERYFHIVDPDGHEISFARPLSR